MRRMRTIQQAASEIRESDPSTAVREYAIRQLVISGVCPSFKVGRKYLLDFDVLLSILGGETVSQKEEEIPGNYNEVKMRRIGG